MNRIATAAPLSWSVMAPVAGGILAAASVLLTYWVSPVFTAGSLAVATGLWVVWRSRTGAIVLLLLSLPLGRLTLVQLGPAPVSPVTVIAIAMFGLWLWKVLTEQQRIRYSWLQAPLAVFLLWGVLGLYNAPNVTDVAKIFLIFAMSGAVYLVISQTLRSVEEARAVMWAIAGAAAAVGVYAIWSNIGGSGGLSDISVYAGEESYNRVEGIFTHPNQMGGFLALAIPPMIALAASERLRWRRLSGYILVAAAITGLALSYSRGAWIGACIGLLILLLLLRKGPALVLGLGLVGAFATSGALLERLQSITSATTAVSVISRFEFWGVALRLVQEHPLFGVGLGNFQEAYGNLMLPGLPLLPVSLEIPPSAHNLFINLAVEVGLIGAVAFGAMLVLAFLLVLRNNRTADRGTRILNLGLGAGLVALLLHNLVEVTVYQGFTAIVLFACLGILDSMRRFDGE